MSRVGIANLPLHGGKAPKWLFSRMTKLAREFTIIFVSEYGTHEFLSRISDPYWFQAVGCVLGFDWHSSGVTTTVCGALQTGINDLQDELGLYIAGGKGGRSRQTPAMIEESAGRAGFSDAQAAELVYASKLSAKVDNTALQDGYQLYQHCFFFDRDRNWAVVQQGMNTANRFARRYHWLSDDLSDFVNEPEKAICCDQRSQVLNLVAAGSATTRHMSSNLVKASSVERLIADLDKLSTLTLPAHHPVTELDFDTRRLARVLSVIREHEPKDFETLLAIKGVGPKTMRALALISELIYGSKLSWQDPARFSFAHGGKDGFPFPVDRPLYDQSISIMHTIVDRMKLEKSDKSRRLRAIRSIFT